MEEKDKEIGKVTAAEFDEKTGLYHCTVEVNENYTKELFKDTDVKTMGITVGGQVLKEHSIDGVKYIDSMKLIGVSLMDRR